MKEKGRKVVAQNRKARHDYAIEDTYEAGLVLVGTEVKSLRAGRASLVDGFAVIRDGEAWLQGVHIPEYTEGTWTNHEPRRERKLLMHKHEILRLIGKTRESGLTLVPLALYFKDGTGQGRDRTGPRQAHLRQARRRWPSARPPGKRSARWRAEVASSELRPRVRNIAGAPRAVGAHESHRADAVRRPRGHAPSPICPTPWWGRTRCWCGCGPPG